MANQYILIYWKRGKMAAGRLSFCSCFLLFVFSLLIHLYQKVTFKHYNERKGCIRTHKSSETPRYFSLLAVIVKDRGLPRKVGYGLKNSMCMRYGKNPFASFCIMMLLLSGDINMNPGPPKYPCGLCKKGVGAKKDAIRCDGCGTWFHVRQQCIMMPRQVFQSYCNQPDLRWNCNECSEKTTETQMNGSEEELDPFDALQENLRSTGLKIGHLNVNGLLAKMVEIQVLLQRIKLDILAISETHLTKHVKEEMVKVEGYKMSRFDSLDGD